MSAPTILVVVDEPGIVDIVATNLSAEGFEVISAADGKAGLVLAGSDSPDLIVLDIMMPGIDGWEVLRRLEADPVTAGTPVILLTVRIDDADILQGFERGAVEYITKPFFPENLVASVKSALTALNPELRGQRRQHLIERRRATLDRAQEDQN